MGVPIGRGGNVEEFADFPQVCLFEHGGEESFASVEEAGELGYLNGEVDGPQPQELPEVTAHGPQVVFGGQKIIFLPEFQEIVVSEKFFMET